MKRLPPVMQRCAMIVVVCLSFVVMASIFVPGPSRAADNLRPAVELPAVSDSAARYGVSVDPHEGLARLGQLIGREYTVEIYAGDPEALFTVYDDTGRLLATLRTQEQLKQEFPEIDLDGMQGDIPVLFAGTPIDE